MANSKNRWLTMDTTEILKTLSEIAIGTWINRAKADFMGIPVKSSGFPNFSKYAYPRTTVPSINTAQLSTGFFKLLVLDEMRPITGLAYIDLTGKRSSDFRNARRKAGISGLNEWLYTWHHHEVVGVMVLVSSFTHPHLGGLKHFGGVFFWELSTGKKYDEKK